MSEEATILCNVAWPCFEQAHSAVKVFDTTPRFACINHVYDMVVKGAEVRPLSSNPGPWVAPSIQKEGEIVLTNTCCNPACAGKVCTGGR